MSALRVPWICTSIAFGSALLASASSQAASATDQQVLDAYCKSMGKFYNIANPDQYAWSNTQQGSVVANENGLSQSVARADSSSQGERCPEGKPRCVANCDLFDLFGWKDGGTGAWFGCRLACDILCGRGF